MDEMKERLVSNSFSHEILVEEPELPQLAGSLSNYENLVKTLGEMGFPTKIIEGAIAYTGGKSVQELLPYLVKGEQGWEHSFIPTETNPEVCEICREHPSEHLDFQSGKPENIHEKLEEVKQRQDMYSRQFSQEIKAYEGETCCICFEEIKEEWRHPECGEHVFCVDCVKAYLQVKINEGAVLEIRCPGEACQHLLSEELISELVTSELFEKYKKFKFQAELNKNPNGRWCITPDCEGYMTGSQEERYLKCPECSKEICFNCRQAWHPDKTCEALIDEGYNEWAKGKEVQLCPRCKARIEKLEGCNHMTCSVCNYEWCWLCRGRYTSNHFSPINPFGCPGLQGGENVRGNWPVGRIYARRVRNLCLWVLFIVFFPVVALIYPAAEAVRGTNQALEGRGYGCCSRLVIEVFVFLGTVALTPVAIVVLLPVLVVLGIRSLVRRLFA